MALTSMHHHIAPRSTPLKQGTFPPMRFCCPHHPQYDVPLRLLTRLRPGFRSDVLMPRLPRGVDPRPREISLVALMALPAFRSPYAGGFFEAARPESSPLPWPSRQMKRSAPPCSPCGAYHVGAAGFPSWYGLRSCAPFTGGYCASPHPVAQVQRQPATWLSGDYHDRTSTG